MPGDIWQKFANLRLLFMTLWMHPGKKLLFMGGEFGQWSEWYCKTSLDWHLLETNELHAKLVSFVADLNWLYRKNPALWEQDFTYEGFQWLDLEDRDNSIISFVRYAKNRDDHVVCILNFTPQTHYFYKIGLPSGSRYREIFCSDDPIYGGSNNSDKATYLSIPEPHAQAKFHTTLTVPPLAGVLLRPFS
jgi:1,4-alpha-glucan branching enzyme